ncbi:MAG: NAD(P)H-binding protein [Proteobacteria bacterium]|nr:NAD(P)H-binding protein [Pseudomonadota bacterium]
MATVHFLREGREVDVRIGTTLRAAARAADVCVYSRARKLLNCYGHGRCGSCRLVVTDGWDRLTAPTAKEHAAPRPLRGGAHQPAGIVPPLRERLACQARVMGDVALWTHPDQGAPSVAPESDPPCPKKRRRKGPVALTGATGLLGAVVARELQARGHTVRALIRGGREGAEHIDEEIVGDLRNPVSLERLVHKASAVIHCASAMGTNDAALLDAVNVEGTRDLVRLAHGAGVPRFILVSSIAARRPADGPYSASKWAQEDAVRRGGVPWVVLQPPVMVGNNSQVERAVENIGRRSPRVPVVGGDAPLYPVHVEDVATACVEAMERNGALGTTYQLGGPDAVTFRELASALLGEGGAADVVTIPVPLARAIAAVLGTVVPDKAPLTTEAVRAIVAGTPVDLGPARADLGFAPRTLAAALS